MPNGKLDHIKREGITEARRLFWIFVYLWVLLGLFAIHKSLVLNERSLLYHQGFAFINAWLLAKVMLTGEMFHLADNLRHKPLIYPIVFKSVVFSVVLVAFYLIEEILVGVWHGKSIAESVAAVGGGSVKGILVVGLLMCVVLSPFFALREFAKDVGDDKLFEQFFLRRRKFGPLEF